MAGAAVLIASSANAYRISGWVPPWNANALSSIEQHQLDEANPVWYSLGANGRITPNWNAENATWRAAMVGSEILPTIQNVVNRSYDASVVVSQIATPASREAHAAAIHQLVISRGFDGIDIDYEALPRSARANFSAFIAVLGKKLHASERKLSVTVHPKTDDAASWDGPAAQDWREIGRHADRVKIMAYDFHWATSEAGVITPLDWLDRVATFAERSIPSEKISIALPLYGYDWVGKRGTGVSYAEAMATARAKGATMRRDGSGEPTYAYGDHVVFFQDAASYRAKVELLRKRHPAITRLAHWAIGQEDPAVWGVIDDVRSVAVATKPAPKRVATVRR